MGTASGHQHGIWQPSHAAFDQSHASTSGPPPPAFPQRSPRQCENIDAFELATSSEGQAAIKRVRGWLQGAPARKIAPAWHLCMCMACDAPPLTTPAGRGGPTHPRAVLGEARGNIRQPGCRGPAGRLSLPARPEWRRLCRAHGAAGRHAAVAGGEPEGRTGPVRQRPGGWLAGPHMAV